MRTIIFIGQYSRVQGGAEKYFYSLFCDFSTYIGNINAYNSICIDYKDSLSFAQAFRYALFSRRDILFVINMSVLFQFSHSLLLLSLFRKKTIILPHIVASAALMRPKFAIIRHLLFHINFHMASRVISISDGNKQQLLNLPFSNDKDMFTVYNYVDFPMLRRSKVEYPKSPLNIAVIGRLQNKHKGQLNLIKNNLNFLKSSDINLSLYGDGPDKASIKSLLTYHSLQHKIFMYGHIETESIYKNHDFSAVLSYSYWEGLPLNLLEAYFFGKIVIGRNIPGIKEIVFPRLCYSSDAELREIVSNLKIYFLDRAFLAQYSSFAAKVLSKYNKISSISTLACQLLDNP